MSKNETLNVILIRHGQTQANACGVAQGQTDSALTQEGVAETLRKAAILNGHVFHAVYCSDLPRAMATMRIVRNAIPGLPEPAFTPQLREIDFGDYSGMDKERIMPVIMRHKADKSLRYPNGECGNDLIARTDGFFRTLMSRHMGESVLVITHYGIMETAARLFTGFPADKAVVIGGDDVWEMEFDANGMAKLRVV
ncbi:MAG: histidine phosphatase family protein [Nitrospinae bacterium]|nr:histidine phosphatase family protein [Nitrospinota bacterium]